MTIKELANLAGVSRGTVDRVLNKRGGVNSDTEARIWKLVEETGYKTNDVARALSGQKNKIRIGVILNGNGNTFFNDVITGVEVQASHLQSFGCEVLIQNVKATPESQLISIEKLLQQDIGGLVISPCNDFSIAARINQLVSDYGIPVITVNTDIESCGRLCYVGSDFFRSGQTAAGLIGLITGGTGSIGILSGYENILCHSERIRGFQECLQRKFPQMQIVEIRENEDDELESYIQTREMLQHHPEIDAIFFAAGGVYGGCRALREHTKPIHAICFDLPEKTKEMLQNGTISAAICQEPITQGMKSVELMYQYLSHRILPEKEYFYLDLNIKIAENIQ
ncbi:MAG: LacI family DNA-binding transcriptional regulator [Lachnospiraceae bacterium]